MNIKKIRALKSKLTEESVGTAMVLDVVDFVDNIRARCKARGSMLSDKEIEIMLLTANYLLAKKATKLEGN